MTEITIEAGAVLDLEFAYQEPDESAVNVTGWTGRMQVRRDYSTAVPLLDLTATVDGPAGTFTVHADATATAALGVGRAVWDIEVYPAADPAQAIRLASGVALITPEVTRG